MGMSMTKEEAIQAMKNGRKVRHCYFSKEEWMTMNSDGMVVLEDGVMKISIDGEHQRIGRMDMK